MRGKVIRANISPVKVNIISKFSGEKKKERSVSVSSNSTFDPKK